jgi:hypothetical protein
VGEKKKKRSYLEGVSGLKKEPEATKRRKTWNTQNVYEIVSGQQAWNARFRGQV